MVAPFVEGDILQIIFMAVIFGVALNAMGKVGAPVLDVRPAPHQGHVQDPGLHHEGRPAGRVRRDGLRRRQVRRLHPLQPGRADRASSTPPRSSSSSWSSASVMAFLKLNIFKMLRHLKEECCSILGTSTAEPALPGLMRKLEHAGVKKETRRARRPHRLQLQPRRRRDLPFAGRGLHRPGHQHRPDHRPAAGPHRRHAAHLQGRGRRRRRRVHRPDRHPEPPSAPSRPPASC